MRELIYFKDVVTLKLDREKYVGCGMCLMVCPHVVFTLDNGRTWIINKDACMECGACVQNCPVEALYVRTGEGCAKAIFNEMISRKCDCC